MIIVAAAIVIDMLIGDPRGLPHPVRMIARLARTLETFFRNRISSPFFAGLATAALVYLVSFFIPYIIVLTGNMIHPFLGGAIGAVIIATTIATRDLLNHSLAVYHALKLDNLDDARMKVGMIVGRDTTGLSRPEIVRACVESIAESMVDGVTAPLFFAVFGGPAWAMLYRAVNTLDSLFGYKNPAYIDFGTVSARTDDAANYIPARLTAPLVSLAAAVLLYHPLDTLRILFRDGRKHPSPNSGLSEAAMAGALGIRLGGENYYNGIKSTKSFLGDPGETLANVHIVRANKLMVATVIFTTLLYFTIDWFIHSGGWTNG